MVSIAFFSVAQDGFLFLNANQASEPVASDAVTIELSHFQTGSNQLALNYSQDAITSLFKYS